MCVSIAQIKTNADSYAKVQKSPYYCKLDLEYDTPQGCRYEYKLANGQTAVIAEDFCECSLNANLNSQNIGICPFPG